MFKKDEVNVLISDYRDQIAHIWRDPEELLPSLSVYELRRKIDKTTEILNRIEEIKNA